MEEETKPRRSCCRSCSDVNTAARHHHRHRSSPPPPPLLLRFIFAGLRLHRSRDHHRHARNNYLSFRFNPLIVIIHKIYTQSLFMRCFLFCSDSRIEEGLRNP
ncbi:hypothetical protein Bca4012_070071 [Brassica carinata]